MTAAWSFHAATATCRSASPTRWRTGTIRMTVVGHTVSRLVEETWDSSWHSRWTAFGDPRPFVTSFNGVRAIFPNGDDTYSSGAYTTHRFDARRGLAVEALVRTRITRALWQQLKIQLGPIDDFGHDGAPSGSDSFGIRLGRGSSAAVMAFQASSIFTPRRDPERRVVQASLQLFPTERAVTPSTPRRGSRISALPRHPPDGGDHRCPDLSRRYLRRPAHPLQAFPPASLTRSDATDSGEAQTPL